MVERRNTYTAVLFLIALFSAAVFLVLGIIPNSSGFLEQDRPPRQTQIEVKTKLPSPKKVLYPGQRRDWAERKKHRTEPQRRSCDLSIWGHSTSPITYESVNQAVTGFTDSVNPTINKILDRNHTFIELYGGVQRLLGRRVIEDTDPQYTVVRLTDRMLTFATLEPESTNITLRANEMIRFARRVKAEYRIPVLYVQAPSKLDLSPLPDGIVDYGNSNADRFLKILRNGKVDTLDLRTTFRKVAEKNPEKAETFFFRTDHHWTHAGGFLGYQTLVKKLNRYPYCFNIDQELTDPDNFTIYTFKNIFLGSHGRRVGTLYAGLDDIDVWVPKFPTDFSYSVPIVNVERDGPFVTSLLLPELLAETDLYNTNPYSVYGKDYLLARTVNKNNPDGKRVLVLRDSFGCALTPFLSLGCQELIAIDPRDFNGNQDTMMDFIDWLKPDVIIVLNSTGGLRVDKLFPYLPTARQNALAAERADAEKKGSTQD